MNMNLNLSELHTVFYSGMFSDQGDRGALFPIYELLQLNKLTHNTITIATKTHYLTTIQEMQRHQHIDQVNGSPEHKALASLAQDWLHIQGFESKTEQTFCGHYPDVITSDKQTIVECGNTGNPEKLLQYFDQGNVAEVIQLPYPTYENSCLVAHRFVAQTGLHNAIHVLRQQQNRDILDILNRPNR